MERLLNLVYAGFNSFPVECMLTAQVIRWRCYMSVIKRLTTILIILALVLMSSVSPVFAQHGTSLLSNPAVQIDPIGDRNPGDRVTISGATTLGEITIRVISPKNVVMYVNTTKDADFSVSFILPADAETGEYQVVAGLGETVASQKFNVLKKVEIISIDKVTAETVAGRAPVLPSVVTARYSDGSTGQLPVVWDAIDPSKYASAGTFIVEGTVTGTGIKAVAEVTVKASPPSIMFDPIGDKNPGDRVTISGRTTLGEIIIRVISPKNIVIYVNTAKGTDFSVSFILPDDAETGEYQVVAGLGETVASQKFNVLKKAEIISIDKVTAETVAGTAPVLPSVVTARYSDGSTRQLPVVWDAVDPSKYASAGTFTVEGTVTGTSIKAVAEVTVKEDTTPVIVSIDKVTVTTYAGTAPALPSVVTARYSDGSTKQLSVVWDAIDPSKYASAGTFTVEGTVTGTSIKAIATITVVRKQDSEGSGGEETSSGSSVRVTPTQPPVKTGMPDIGNGIITFKELEANESGQVNVNVDENDLEKALEGVNADSDGIKTVTVNVPPVGGANEYRLTVPASLLSSDTLDTRVNIATDIGTVELPSNMFNNTVVDEDEITVSIGIASTEGMSRELVEAIGDRPVIELGVFARDERISWNNINAPVKVTIKYQPSNMEEVLNSEFITIWYIDGEGNVVPVTNARYNPETGEISFTITHFSRFAVVYVVKTFTDLSSHPWAKHEIEVLASKGIIKGISKDLYDPSSNITRADFLKLLITTLDLKAVVTDNFIDVHKDDYYYETVGIAKALGIVKGVGDERFEPKTPVTRQDMMVMVDRALDVAKLQLEDVTGKILSSFDDADEVADYAKASVEKLIRSAIIKGSNNLINPRGNTTRAEAAVVLYRLYNIK